MKPNIQKIKESTGKGTPISRSSLARHLGVTWELLDYLLKSTNPNNDNDPLVLKALKYIKSRNRVCNIERIGYLSRPNSILRRAHITKITGIPRQKLKLIFENPKRHREKPESLVIDKYRDNLREQGIVIVDKTIDKKIKNNQE